MRRREFIAGLRGAAVWPFARPLAAEAQRRVGALLSSDDNQPALDAFREGLATFGWVEGRNLRLDYCFTDGGDPRRLAEYAEELVNLRPDVVFAAFFRLQMAEIGVRLAEHKRFPFPCPLDPIGGKKGGTD
jgi:hypothetical protein